MKCISRKVGLLVLALICLLVPINADATTKSRTNPKKPKIESKSRHAGAKTRTVVGKVGKGVYKAGEGTVRFFSGLVGGHGRHQKHRGK